MRTVNVSLYKIPSYAGCAVGCFVLLVLFIMYIIRIIPRKPKQAQENEDESGSGVNINERDVNVPDEQTESAHLDLYTNAGAGQNDDPHIIRKVDARPKDLSSDDDI